MRTKSGLNLLLAILVATFLFPPAGAATKPSLKSKSQSRKKAGAHGRLLKSLRARKAKRVFVASADLRPMAQQLMEARTPGAYAGVEKYARQHAKDPEAASLAWLAIGYAHTLDHEYAAAIPYLKRAQAHAGELSDYVDYHLATAYGDSNDSPSAAAVLHGFDARYPDSLLSRDAALVEASALLAQHDASAAISLLRAHRSPPRADIELALGRAEEQSANFAEAAKIFQQIFYTMPLAPEAAAAQQELQTLSRTQSVTAPSVEMRKQRAALLVERRHASDAAPEYRTLLEQASEADRPQMTLALANALWRSGGSREALDLLRRMPDPGGELGAQRLYYLVELSRPDVKLVADYITQLRASAPESAWFEEALLAAANMYLLQDDQGTAGRFFGEMAERFPQGKRGFYANWKSGWLAFRAGDIEAAKRAFERQMSLYPASPEASAAFFWRGRLAEEGNDPAQARSLYARGAERYGNDYYSLLSRQRLREMGASSTPLSSAEKAEPDASDQPAAPPNFSLTIPPDNLRAQKSLLLENCGLTDFAVRELQAAGAETGGNWSVAQIAKLLSGSGKYNAAIETLKRATPRYYAYSPADLPRQIWEGLFPRPYWDPLKRHAGANQLDPFLVASLIRQESEFNPGAVSPANAVGLMQLLPSVGKKLAREARVRGFNSGMLLDPEINIELGTRYLRHLLEKYDGKLEYALAAYNAGSERVDAWRNHSYRDIHEFVESIPFTETREYVQAIVRNQEMYTQLYRTP